MPTLAFVSAVRLHNFAIPSAGGSFYVRTNAWKVKRRDKEGDDEIPNDDDTTRGCLSDSDVEDDAATTTFLTTTAGDDDGDDEADDDDAGNSAHFTANDEIRRKDTIPSKEIRWHCSNKHAHTHTRTHTHTHTHTHSRTPLLLSLPLSSRPQDSLRIPNGRKRHFHSVPGADSFQGDSIVAEPPWGCSSRPSSSFSDRG